MHGATEMHGDIVPIGELLRNSTIARRIVFLEIVEGRVGEDDPKAERIVGAVALIDGDFGIGPLLAKQDRSIEPSRSATDDRDLHKGLRLSENVIILNLKHFSASPPCSLGMPSVALK